VGLDMRAFPPRPADLVKATLPTGNLTRLDAIPDVTPAIIEVALDAQKSVYANAFKLLYSITVAFGGEYLPTPRLPPISKLTLV
jgi:hypothetical protein